jgi:hypothetical protein
MQRMIVSIHIQLMWHNGKIIHPYLEKWKDRLAPQPCQKMGDRIWTVNDVHPMRRQKDRIRG